MNLFTRVSSTLAVAAGVTVVASTLAAAQGVMRLNGEPVGPVVMNQPYSADVVSTTTQVLADGTRIERSVSGKVYRDSAGRTRREQTILGFTWGAFSQTDAQTVTITDPAAGVTYTLDPRNRTARLSPTVVSVFFTPAEAAARAGARTGRAGGAGGRTAGPRAGGAGAGVGGATRGQPTAGVRVELLGDLPTWFATQFPPVGRDSTSVTESLAAREIEGVMATGRRTTETIAVGQIGNDRPIVVTDERWESSELGVLMLSIHRDPRTGDVEYRLVNVSRAEPPPALFTVPQDYRVIEGPGMRQQ